MADELLGTYVLGTYQGVTEGDFPALQIGTYVKADGTLFVERVDFQAFNARTGEKIVPDGIKVGTKIAVRIRFDAKGYKDKVTGEDKMFVSRRALAVVPIG